MESETEAEIEQKIIKVADMIGIVLKLEAISITHRLENKRKAKDTRKPRPVIVRFTKRAQRNNMLQKKGPLKGRHTKRQE